jgi:CheY-like chemotaxis protein
MDSASDNGLTVLVVEDVEWIREGMRESLEAYGHRVLEAPDSEEAISLAERFHPDLILTEEELPTFDALMRSVREHPTLGNISIVIINPDTEEGDGYGDVVILTDYSQLIRVLNLPGKS